MRKPKVVDVALPQEVEVNGKAGLLLKVFQSVEERQPAVVPFAVAQVRAEAEDPMTAIGCESERAPEAVKVVVPTD